MMGLPKRSFAALHGAGYAVGQPGGAQDPCGGLYCRSQPSLMSPESTLLLFVRRSYASNGWRHGGTTLDNSFFKDVLDMDIAHFHHLLTVDKVFRTDTELLAITHEFAGNNTLFLSEFQKAWTWLANADRLELINLEH